MWNWIIITEFFQVCKASYFAIKGITRTTISHEVGHTYVCLSVSVFKVLGNLPVEWAKDAVCFLQRCGVSLVSSYGVCFLQRGGVSLASSAIIYNIVKVKVTRWPVELFDPLTRRPVDLFENEPLKGKWEVNLHTPSKFCEDPSKDLGVHREQTNKLCLNYKSMIIIKLV